MAGKSGNLRMDFLINPEDPSSKGDFIPVWPAEGESADRDPEVVRTVSIEIKNLSERARAVLPLLKELDDQLDGAITDVLSSVTQSAWDAALEEKD